MSGPPAPAGERRATGGFLVAAACFLALVVVYARGGQVQLEGTLLGVGFAGLCFGFVTWGNDVLDREVVVGVREALASEPEEVHELEETLHDDELPRRSILKRAAALSIAALGAALVLPIRSLGPAPGRSLAETGWRGGKRAVGDDGRLIHVEDVPVDGLVTIFPEGEPGSADGQAVLIRVAPGVALPRPGRETWSPDGLIAYSKLCTHAGCPVGLYQPGNHQLLCPCHQSTFDVLDGARPLFGPAAVSLPQLPLAIDADGYIRSTGDFSEPVGPAYWGRDR